MRILKLVAAAGMAVFLGSCATLDEGQCRSGDWQGIGFGDGAAGYPQSRLAEHAKACGKFGITPDAAAYDRGRRDGLVSFCTPRRGFEEGRQGHTYYNVCPAGLEPGFLAGYADGELVAAANRRVSEARSEASSARSRAEDFERQIRDNEARLNDPNFPAQEKDNIRTTLRSLRDSRDRAWDDERRAQRRIRDAQAEADDLRARFIPDYGTW